jgi:hypothetical protein
MQDHEACATYEWLCGYFALVLPALLTVHCVHQTSRANETYKYSLCLPLWGRLPVLICILKRNVLEELICCVIDHYTATESLSALRFLIITRLSEFGHECSISCRI